MLEENSWPEDKSSRHMLTLTAWGWGVRELNIKMILMECGSRPASNIDQQSLLLQSSPNSIYLLQKGMRPRWGGGAEESEGTGEKRNSSTEIIIIN